MLSENERQTIDLPGVGEIKGRPGTSTMQLAGAAKFWYVKYQSARKDGFIAATSLIITLEVVIGIAYHYLRSH